jgi:hypothetical protein
MSCEVMINGVAYVPNDSKPPSPIRVVILQRGWVAVGRFSQTGSDCTLTNAAIIRVWGTTKGLPEIAQNGPTSKTVLDPSPTLRFHQLTIITTIDCEESKWNSKLT